MDELWSFVDDKDNEQWVWLALDVVTSEIVGCYIGDLAKRGTAWSGEAWRCARPSVVAVAISQRLALRDRKARISSSSLAIANGYISRMCSILLQEARKSHQHNLEFYSSLQCFFTCAYILSFLGLPTDLLNDPATKADVNLKLIIDF